MPTFTTNASADDANEVVSSGAMNLTDDGSIGSAVARLNGTNHGGFRFPNVTIAKNTTISSAILKFPQLANYTGGGVAISQQTIYGEASDNSAQFTTSANNISSRSRTTATGTNPLDTATGGASQDIVVTSIVQEIVNRSGWSSGNALSILFIGTGSTAGNWIQPYMYDYFSGTYKAQLIITTASATKTYLGFF